MTINQEKSLFLHLEKLQIFSEKCVFVLTTFLKINFRTLLHRYAWSFKQR